MEGDRMVLWWALTPEPARMRGRAAGPSLISCPGYHCLARVPLLHSPFVLWVQSVSDHVLGGGARPLSVDTPSQRP